MRHVGRFMFTVGMVIGLTAHVSWSATPVGTSTTYQGQIKDSGLPANGLYDFEFRLYDQRDDGVEIDLAVAEKVEVTDGLFTAVLDFAPSSFTGEERWLEIAMRRSVAGDPFNVLTPRQLLTAAPYALYALNGVSDAEGYWAATGNDIYNTNTGRVGIGTAAPAFPLHLTAAAQIMAKIASGHTAGTWLDIENTSTGGKRWGMVSTGSANGEGPGHLLLRAITDGRTVMTLLGDGNVGVGTTAPVARLDVAGTARVSGFQLTTGAQSGYVLTSNASGTGTWQAPDADQFWNAGTGGIYHLGRVGIGSSSPGAAFDVENLVWIDSTGQNAGYVWTQGPTGIYNAGLTHLDGYPNNGYVSVRDSANQNSASLYVNANGFGVVFADVKNFRVPNPRKADTEIVYACLEGPEAAAYVRGTAKLYGGRAVVPLPEHFQDVAVAEGMTVQVTPCSSASKGLAVVEQTLDHFAVEELLQGSGEYEFHWRVEAVRRGHEDYRVIRSRFEDQPADARTP